MTFYILSKTQTICDVMNRLRQQKAIRTFRQNVEALTEPMMRELGDISFFWNEASDLPQPNRSVIRQSLDESRTAIENKYADDVLVEVRKLVKAIPDCNPKDELSKVLSDINAQTAQKIAEINAQHHTNHFAPKIKVEEEVEFVFDRPNRIEQKIRELTKERRKIDRTLAGLRRSGSA